MDDGIIVNRSGNCLSDQRNMILAWCSCFDFTPNDPDILWCGDSRPDLSSIPSKNIDGDIKPRNNHVFSDTTCMLFEDGQIRPINTRAKTIIRTSPRPPLGKYPQDRLWGYAGNAPKTNNSNTISKIVLMVLSDMSGLIVVRSYPAQTDEP